MAVDETGPLDWEPLPPSVPGPVRDYAPFHRGGANGAPLGVPGIEPKMTNREVGIARREVSPGSRVCDQENESYQNAPQERGTWP